MPIEIEVALGVLFLFSLLWAIVMSMANAEKILDRLSDHPEGTGEKNRSGMKKIEEFRERMETFKYMANDSESVRLADGFLEWIDAIDNEFCEERTNLQLKIKVLEESVKTWTNECYEAMAKATELKESAKSWEQKYNEANVEAMKIRVDSGQKLRAAQEETNEWKRKYFEPKKEDPLYDAGLLYCGGRDADGMLQKCWDPIVTIQMPRDVYTEQKAKFESQAKEIEALKKQLEIERSVVKFSGLDTYVVHAWKGDSLWKIYRYAPSEEALYDQLHRDGYCRIDYTRKVEA